MNHWTRSDRLTDASLRSRGLRRALVLLGVTFSLMLSLGASSAFAVTANPFPLEFSNFQGADGNQDNPCAETGPPAAFNCNAALPAIAGDFGGLYAPGAPVPHTGDASTPDGHREIDWQTLAQTPNNACPPLNAPVGCLASTTDPSTNDTIFAGSSKETEPDIWQFTTQNGGASPPKDNILAAWSSDANSVDPAHPATFLYLAFTRQAPSGNTFLTFELNQRGANEPNGTWGPNSKGQSGLPCRLTGDVLISYEVTPSGDPVEIRLYRWKTDAGQGVAGTGPDVDHQCGKKGSFTGGAALAPPEAEGAMNFDSDILNYFSAGGTFEAGTFGEASINLTRALSGLSVQDCFQFGQVQMHSRSAVAIDSSLQDRVTPFPIGVRSCSIEVKKKVVPATDAGKFNLQVDGTTKTIAGGVGDGGSTGSVLVDKGNHGAGETAVTGTSLSNYTTTWECVKDGDESTKLTGTGTTTGATALAVGTGTNWVCTFTNTAKPKLTVVKEIEPAGGAASDPGKFNLFGNLGAVDGTQVVTRANAGDGDATSTVTVDPGTYSVHETEGTDTHLADYSSSISCTKPAAAGGTTTVASGTGTSLTGIVLGTADNVTCTITNTRLQGTLKVIKSVVSASGGTDDGLFKLKIDNGTASAAIDHNGGSLGPQAVSPYTSHSVSEIAGDGTTDLANYTTNVSCIDTAHGNEVVASATDVSLASAAKTLSSIQVDSTDTIECTFTNTRKQGTLKIVKDLIPAAGALSDPGKFDLNIDGGTAEATNVGDGGETPATSVSPYSEHAIAEAANAGSPTTLGDYDSTTSCTKNGQPYLASEGGTSRSSIAVGSGDVVVCTVTNTRKQGTLKVIKDLIPAAGALSDPGKFDLDIDGGTAEATNVGDGGETLATAVSPYSDHSIGEAANAGSPTTLGDYDSTTSCTKNGNPYLASAAGISRASISVGSQDAVVCIITNTRKSGHVKVIKQIVPAAGANSDEGTFNLQVDDVTKAAAVAYPGGNTGNVNVSPYSNHGVGETGAGSTDLDNYTTTTECIRNGDDENPVADPTDFAVGSQDEVVCTIVNTRKSGTLKVIKDLIPAPGENSDAGTFDLNIDGNAEASDVGDGGSTGDVPVSPYDDHSVSEAAGATSPTTLADYDSSTACKRNGNAIANLDVDHISVGSQDAVVCTITNTRKAGHVKVVKQIVPAAGANSDDGTFDLQVDDVTKASDIAYPGGDTGNVNVSPNENHGVGETAAGSTDLGDYTTTTECIRNGDDENPIADPTDFAVGSQDEVICTIVNTRKSGTLKVLKDLIPAAGAESDDGTFDLNIDGTAKASDVGDGGSTGDVPVSPYDDHSVSEAAGATSPTTLSDYDSSTACKRNGNTIADLDVDHIVVGSQDSVVCIISNTRKSGHVKVIKQIVPAAGANSDDGTFNLKVDGSTKAAAVGFPGGNTGNVDVSPYENHGVSETGAGGTDLDNYTTTTECIRNGDDENPVADPTDFAVGSQDEVICTIVNTRKSGTLEVVKHLLPEGDNGKFNLLIDDSVKTAQGGVGDGGTTGAVHVSPYDGHSVSETGAAGTDLGDYSSSTACTRNGQPIAELDPDNVAVGSQDTVVCTITNTLVPIHVGIDKTGPDFAHDGDKLTYVIKVTNPGTTALHNVNVTDAIKGQTHGCDAGGGPTLTGGDANSDGLLQPSETWSFSCTYTVQHSDENAGHNIINVATVQATDNSGHSVGPVDDDATTKIIHPAIAIDKTGPATAQAGDKVGYVLTVTNPGDTPLGDPTVKVSDEQCNGDPVALLPNGKGGDASPGTLDPGDTWTYSCSVQTALGDNAIHNIASVTGCDQLGGCVNAGDTADTTLTQPELLVLPERIVPGTAKLQGPTGCAAKAFNARIRGTKIATVTFVLDGKIVKRVKNTKDAKLIQLRVNPAKFRIGVHRLVVNITFKSGSGTKPKTMRLSFQRCAKKLAAPRFTG